MQPSCYLTCQSQISELEFLNFFVHTNISLKGFFSGFSSGSTLSTDF